jgi:hypothetical protein
VHPVWKLAPYESQLPVGEGPVFDVALAGRFKLPVGQATELPADAAQAQWDLAVKLSAGPR